MNDYRCTVCSYTYRPARGDKIRDIDPNTSFEDLPDDWRCPTCNQTKMAFVEVKKKGENILDQKVFFQILQSREDRALMQEEIIAKYNNPIISFTLNIPGPIKDNDKYREIHDVGMEAISNTLRAADYDIEFMDRINKSTGPEGYFSVNIDPLELKRLTVKIETEHPLGRLFDIDIFDSNMEQVARADLGLGPRKCLICENEAKVCNKAASHTLDDLLKRIDNIYSLYFKSF